MSATFWKAGAHSLHRADCLHRINVERWRISQARLVRTVTAQIANEPDLDELAHKVTRLIQATFKYYCWHLHARCRGNPFSRFVPVLGLPRGSGHKFRKSRPMWR